MLDERFGRNTHNSGLLRVCRPYMNQINWNVHKAVTWDCHSHQCCEINTWLVESRLQHHPFCNGSGGCSSTPLRWCLTQDPQDQWSHPWELGRSHISSRGSQTYKWLTWSWQGHSTEHGSRVPWSPQQHVEGESEGRNATARTAQVGSVVYTQEGCCHRIRDADAT